jgi:hypothetical protein
MIHPQWLTAAGLIRARLNLHYRRVVAALKPG